VLFSKIRAKKPFHVEYDTSAFIFVTGIREKEIVVCVVCVVHHKITAPTQDRSHHSTLRSIVSSAGRRKDLTAVKAAGNDFVRQFC
jgi:hypothetical protein